MLALTYLALVSGVALCNQRALSSIPDLNNTTRVYRNIIALNDLLSPSLTIQYWFTNESRTAPTTVDRVNNPCDLLFFVKNSEVENVQDSSSNSCRIHPQFFFWHRNSSFKFLHRSMFLVQVVSSILLSAQSNVGTRGDYVRGRSVRGFIPSSSILSALSRWPVTSRPLAPFIFLGCIVKDG